VGDALFRLVLSGQSEMGRRSDRQLVNLYACDRLGWSMYYDDRRLDLQFDNRWRRFVGDLFDRQSERRCSVVFRLYPLVRLYRGGFVAVGQWNRVDDAIPEIYEISTERGTEEDQQVGEVDVANLSLHISLCLADWRIRCMYRLSGVDDGDMVVSLVRSTLSQHTSTPCPYSMPTCEHSSNTGTDRLLHEVSDAIGRRYHLCHMDLFGQDVDQLSTVLCSIETW